MYCLHLHDRTTIPKHGGINFNKQNINEKYTSSNNTVPSTITELLITLYSVIRQKNYHKRMFIKQANTSEEITKKKLPIKNIIASQLQNKHHFKTNSYSLHGGRLL